MTRVWRYVHLRVFIIEITCTLHKIGFSEGLNFMGPSDTHWICGFIPCEAWKPNPFPKRRTPHIGMIMAIGEDLLDMGSDKLVKPWRFPGVSQ